MFRLALTVPAAEANRRFSKLLRAAREGTQITITSHGEPIAQLGPVDSAAASIERRRRDKAHDELLDHLERLQSVAPIVVGPWTREELYDLD